MEDQNAVKWQEQVQELLDKKVLRFLKPGMRTLNNQSPRKTGVCGSQIVQALQKRVCAVLRLFRSAKTMGVCTS